MSYSKDLEDFILRLKGGVFFLSPREKLFLKFLDEMGIPESVVKRGIEECYRSINPLKRSKYPLFLCFKNVMETYENHLRLEAQRAEIDWERRFWEKLELVKGMVKAKVERPASEEEAQRILKEIETRIVRNLWRKLDREEREKIKEKYKEFKDNKEIYRELVKAEVKKIFGVPDLSLYID